MFWARDTPLIKNTTVGLHNASYIKQLQAEDETSHRSLKKENKLGTGSWMGVWEEARSQPEKENDASLKKKGYQIKITIEKEGYYGVDSMACQLPRGLQTVSERLARHNG